MTHEVTDRHTANTLRRCATSHSLPSFRRARGMSAARTRFQLTPDCVRGRATNAAPQRGAAEAQACFCFLDKTGCASEKSKFQASLILLFLSACTNFAKNFYEEAEIGRGEKSLV